MSEYQRKVNAWSRRKLREMGVPFPADAEFSLDTGFEAGQQIGDMTWDFDSKWIEISWRNASGHCRSEAVHEEFADVLQQLIEIEGED